MSRNNKKTMTKDSDKLASSGWRKAARVVSIIDLVWCSIGLVCAQTALLYAVAVTASLTDHKMDNLRDRLPLLNHLVIGATALLWIVVLFLVGVLALQTISGMRLLAATEAGQTPQGAVDRAKMWMLVTFLDLIFFVGVAGLGFRVNADWMMYTGVIGFMARAFPLFIVIRFVGSLTLVKFEPSVVLYKV